MLEANAGVGLVLVHAIGCAQLFGIDRPCATTATVPGAYAFVCERD